MDIMHWRVEGEMSIRQVGELAPRLFDALHFRSELAVDLSRVTHCDTAGVQLMLMLRREAQRIGTVLRFGPVSPEVRAQLRFYRTESILDDPE